MRLLLLLVVLLAASLFSACETDDDAAPTLQTDVPFRQDGQLAFLTPSGNSLVEIAIEIVETPADRARGLMYRRSMPERSGMLFIMDAEEEQTFTMENTYVPLDMIFVSTDSAVVDIAKRTRPLEQLVTSKAPAKYVIEVRAGFADRHGITDSTRVAWQRSE